MEIPTADPVPLCVDLDGTLLKTDLLQEAVLALLKRQPLALWRLAGWLARGRARLKHELAQRVTLDPALLPYNEPLLAYLREQRAVGRSLVLATASPEPFAQSVAGHLGLFDRVAASSDSTNLKGARKAECLRAWFGERGFDYAGDSSADLAVWAHARQALLVDPTPELAQRVAATTPVARIFQDAGSRWLALSRALRPHQWAKNALLFIPLLAAHRLTEPALLLAAFLAFLAFGLCASSVYVFNDLLDLSADRRHPRKRLRPFAAGRLPIHWGLGLIGIPLALAFGLAALLPGRFALILAGYYVLTLAYSLYLKRVALVDVLLLAGFYTLRIIAGAAAVAVPLSFWLLAFSMFLFLSLALVKRYDELRLMARGGRTRASGRGYGVGDLSLLQNLGGASGYLSVLVLALYINSPASADLYRYPQVLWLLCPVLLYWISRVWLKAHRGQMHEDPVLFALRDRVSLGLAVVIALIGWAAL